jgi:hypothetical protein
MPRIRPPADGQPPAVASPPNLDDLPDLMRVEEFCRFARISKSVAYDAIRRRLIPVLKFGPNSRVLRIPRSYLETELKQLSNHEDKTVN